MVNLFCFLVDKQLDQFQQKMGDMSILSDIANSFIVDKYKLYCFILSIE